MKMNTTSSVEHTIDKLSWGPYHTKLLLNSLGAWINGYLWFAGAVLMTAQMEDISTFQKPCLGPC